MSRMYISVGRVIQFAGEVIPKGWLLCNGAEVERNRYTRLFSAIRTRYGSGNGTTTFNLPDISGRMVMGAGAGAGLTVRSTGEQGGTERHTLSLAEMPVHTHLVRAKNSVGNHPNAEGHYPAGSFRTGQVPRDNPVNTLYSTGADGTMNPGTVVSGGSGQAHENMPPYIAFYYIIKI